MSGPELSAALTDGDTEDAITAHLSRRSSSTIRCSRHASA